MWLICNNNFLSSFYFRQNINVIFFSPKTTTQYAIWPKWLTALPHPGPHVFKFTFDYVLYFMKANTVNPVQTAPKGAVLSWFIVFAISATTLNHKMSKQIPIVVNSGKRLKPVKVHACSHCSGFHTEYRIQIL